MHRAFCSDMYVLFTGKCNFRKKLSKTYKQGRPEKPEHYYAIRQHVLKHYNSDGQNRVLYHPSLEADDMMGILATNGKVANPVICTIDKDLRMIPGWHYTFSYHQYENGDSFPREIGDQEANQNLLKQLLMGDSCDKITGIPGIGEKKAEDIIDDYKARNLDYQGSVIEVAKQIYDDKGVPRFFSENLALTYIWRYPMIVEVLKEPLIRDVASTIKTLCIEEELVTPNTEVE